MRTTRRPQTKRKAARTLPGMRGGWRLRALLLDAVLLATWVWTMACGPGTLTPATLDTRNDACASCRMAVSNAKLAGQIVAPGEEPRFFDDIGCLAAYLKEHPRQGGTAVFVADHLTGRWTAAETAVYARVRTIETPMGSHLVAHASLHSREADAAARDGVATAYEEVFGETR